MGFVRAKRAPPPRKLPRLTSRGAAPSSAAGQRGFPQFRSLFRTQRAARRPSDGALAGRSARAMARALLETCRRCNPEETVRGFGAGALRETVQGWGPLQVSSTKDLGRSCELARQTARRHRLRHAKCCHRSRLLVPARPPAPVHPKVRPHRPWRLPRSTRYRHRQRGMARAPLLRRIARRRGLL